MTEDDKRSIFESLNETNKLESMTMDEINTLNYDQELLVKAAIMNMHQEEKIQHLGHLLLKIKLIVDDKNISSIEAIIKVEEILKVIAFEPIECNGDCNNCDQEH